MKVYWTGDAIVLVELAAFGASSMLAYVWAVGGLFPNPAIPLAQRGRLRSPDPHRRGRRARPS